MKMPADQPNDAPASEAKSQSAEIKELSKKIVKSTRHGKHKDKE